MTLPSGFSGPWTRRPSGSQAATRGGARWTDTQGAGIPWSLGTRSTRRRRPTRSRCTRCCASTHRCLPVAGGVIISRKADVDEAFRRPEVFSSNADALNIGNIRPLIPLQIDPPGPRAIPPAARPPVLPQEDGRARVADCGARAPAHRPLRRPGCLRSGDASSPIPLPSEVFLTMFGLPLEELDTFLRMKDGIIRPDGDQESRPRTAPGDGRGDVRLLQQGARRARRPIRATTC